MIENTTINKNKKQNSKGKREIRNNKKRKQRRYKANNKKKNNRIKQLNYRMNE